MFLVRFHGNDTLRVEPNRGWRQHDVGFCDKRTVLRQRSEFYFVYEVSSPPMGTNFLILEITYGYDTQDSLKSQWEPAIELISQVPGANTGLHRYSQISQ